MAILGFRAKQSEDRGNFVSQVLPEDSYQCSIDRIELREGTKYMSDEKETQLLFYLKPLNVAPEFENKLLFYQTSTCFFNGKSESSRRAMKASKLYNLIKTMYRFYKPEVKVDTMDASQITDTLINDLAGKELIAIVKINENGNNKVSDIMSIKEEIKNKKEMTPDEELAKIMS